MKIGFLARTLMITDRYWNKLQDKADCHWGVTLQELYDALKKRDYEKISFCREEHVFDRNKKSGNQWVAVDPGKAENAVAEMIDPDLWITESLNKLNYVPKKVPWIQIFHSLPIKKHFFYPPVSEYDLILLPGEYHKSELIKRLGLKADDERLKLVGWPRIDDFLNDVFDRDEIMNALGLDVSKKTVMYAPTWGWGFGNETFFARWQGREAEVFESLCRKIKELDLNFIVKLHSLSFYSTNQEMLAIAKKYDVLWLTKATSGYQEDPNPLLWVTDILISDLSGIIAEFLALDRPIIYIEPDEDRDAWEGSDMPRDFRVGRVVKEPEELPRAVEEALNHPQDFCKQRSELLAKLYYRPDGKAIDRAVDEILRFADRVSTLSRTSEGRDTLYV